MVKTDSAALTAIEALLAQTMGFEAQSFGLKALQNTITHQQHILGFTDLAAYFHHLKGSRTARDELIEAVVVPETSFFRNPAAFDYLRRTLTTSADRSTWRILSLPCSTGEEPYSIAITLLEAGIAPQSYLIDAVDISPNALAKASQGLYRRYSFRASNRVQPGIIRRYFQVQGDRYLVGSAARASVQFHQGNLADVDCLWQQPPYDIVFCRNVLIYFHKAARDRALKHFDRLLVPGGLLFVGHAETQLVDPRHFCQCSVPHAFVFEKRVQEKQFKTLVKPVSSPLHRTPTPTQSAQRPLSPVSSVSTSTPAPSEIRPKLDLNQIRVLADRGILGQAQEECDRYLKAHPTAAEAYLLRGEIQQAQGQEAAAESSFHKVLFLNPNCEAALIHLLLHCNQKGDHRGAQRLQQRLNRLHEKQ